MTLQFTPDWKTTLLALLLLPFLLRLGFWQLEREQEKRVILAGFEARQLQPHQDITTLWRAPADQLAFRRVSARGVFDAKLVYLLDNKTRDGRVGFEVIQKFHLARSIDEHSSEAENSARSLWVNRGWLAAGMTREQLPSAETPATEQRLLAEIYVPRGETFALAADTAATQGWPRVVQQLETVFAQSDDASATFPFSVRLQADSPAALVTQWQPVNVQPLKHRGYAIQWFAMAAAVFIFYVFMSSNLMELLRGSGNKTHEASDNGKT